MKTKKRFLVLVQAGDKDWEPTTAELQDLADLYKEAVNELYPEKKEASYAIVVVRHGIKTQIHDLNNAGVAVRDSRGMRKLILEALGKKKVKNCGKVSVINLVT